MVDRFRNGWWWRWWSSPTSQRERSHSEKGNRLKGLPNTKSHLYHPQSKVVCSPWVCCVYTCVLKVIQWCTHHKDDPPPPEDDENKEKRTDDIPVWDQEFLKVDQGTLFELILVNIYFFGGEVDHLSSLELAVLSLFIAALFGLHMMSRCKQTPEQRPKYRRDEATNAGRAVDSQAAKPESGCPDVHLIED